MDKGSARKTGAIWRDWGIDPPRRFAGDRGHLKSALRHALSQINVLEAELAVMREALKRAESAADTDKLTGLPNRRSFDRDLVSSVSRFLHADAHDPIVVGFIDLDGLKIANDLHGHQIGDAMLVNFSKKAKSYLRRGDTLYRQGGDEFLMIAETHDPKLMIHKIKLFQGMCDLPELNPSYKTSFSIGYAVLDNTFLSEHFPDPSRKKLDPQKIADKMVEIADKAMYKNKHIERKTGRDQTTQKPENLLPPAA